jgi:hypothetical protein
LAGARHHPLHPTKEASVEARSVDPSIEHLFRHLEDQLGPVKCPICGHETWHRCDFVVTARAAHPWTLIHLDDPERDPNDPRGEGGGFWAMAYICSRCSFLRMHVINSEKLIERFAQTRAA